MERLKSLFSVIGATVLGGAALATGMALTAQPATAQAAYGSYIGVGPLYSINDDDTGRGEQVGGVIAVRYKLIDLPISIRTQALIGANPSVVPTISYDIPLNWQTDLYIGAGVSFANGGSPSPTGNKTAFAIQPGIDYSFPNSHAVLFGNAVQMFGIL